MTLFPRLTAFTVAILIAAAPLATQAGEGHDHGEAPATPTGSALPRFAATSDTFELVGVLDGHDLTLWLDHAADNSPVEGASLARARTMLEKGEGHALLPFNLSSASAADAGMVCGQDEEELLPMRMALVLASRRAGLGAAVDEVLKGVAS